MVLKHASYYAGVIKGWRQFVRTPPASDPRALVRKQFENRVPSFLELMRRAVFAYPNNPYYKLFEWAGWGFSDLERSVGANGLEATLEELRQAGVYLSHDEFKGRQTVERAGRQMQVDPSDFVNPLVSGALEHRTSGSSGASTATMRSLEYQVYHEAQQSLGVEEFATPNQAFVGLVPVLPGSVGIRWMTYLPRWGHRVDRWFALGKAQDSFHYRALTNVLALQARVAGTKTPFPTYLRDNDFQPVAQRIAQLQAEGINCVLRAGTSRAVRVAAAALEYDLDISGSVFHVGGEALTDAKRAVIERAGAKPYPRYGMVELGSVGWSCREMTKGNCVHVFEDSLAVISHRVKAPYSDEEVDSLLFTTLLPFAPLALLNVGMHDAGTLGLARCDCSWSKLGMTQQVADIIAYGKLTGQGTNLAGSELLVLLECALPERFGGTPVDYQLVEREGAAQTEMELRIHPRLNVASVDEVRAFFLSEVRKLWGGALAQRWWTETQGFCVVRKEPLVSGGHKILPLHLLGPRSATKKQRADPKATANAQ
jgi:hypothetical protein